MEQKTFYVDMRPISFKPDTILFENAFPNEEKEINIYIDNKKIILESTVEYNSGLYDINIIDNFNKLKELGYMLFNNLDLTNNKYVLILSSLLTNNDSGKNIVASNNYFLNPYLNESCLKILKNYFINNGYPYLPKNIVINLSKSNDSHTFKLDITFFIYFCISIYVISETYYYILHNKENEIKKLLSLYTIDNNISNRSIMDLCTRGVMSLINNIDYFMNYTLLDYPPFSISDNFINLDYYENKLKKNYEYKPSTDEYINKSNNTIMKRKGNKLTDTYYIENYSYNDYKPIELLSTFIINNKQTYNNIIIPTYNHLKFLISNPSKKAGYHYCTSCHNSFFGTGRECNNCKSLILKENRKKTSDNKRYDKITNTYNLLKSLANTDLLTIEESEYINSISNISIFKKIYTKNKDKVKIDNLLQKLTFF